MLRRESRQVFQWPDGLGLGYIFFATGWRADSLRPLAEASRAAAPLQNLRLHLHNLQVKPVTGAQGGSPGRALFSHQNPHPLFLFLEACSFFFRCLRPASKTNSVAHFAEAADNQLSRRSSDSQ